MKNDLILDAKKQLNLINPESSLTEKMYRVAAILTQLMDKLDTHPKKINKPIVVGGLSLEFYTESGYTTRDIDFVTSASKRMTELLLELGFNRESRIFFHEHIGVAVDIVDTALEYSESYERLRKIELQDQYFYIISPEDIIIDRILDFGYADNITYCAYLIAMNIATLDFDYIRHNIKWDKDALNEFDNIVKKMNI